MFGVSVVGGFLLFRPFTKERWIGRLPLFLTTASFFLIEALNDLPRAFPQFFERLLGHPISAMLYEPWGTTGTIGSSWFMLWQESLIRAFLGGILLAIFVAILNCIQKRNTKANAMSLVFALLWFAMGLYSALTMFAI